MRSAIITKGIVTNVIRGQIEGSVPCGGDVGIGWLHDGEAFTAPPEPEPEPAPIPDRMSFSQLLIGLVTEGWITEAEGDAWLAGQLPDAVIALISTLPVEQRFAAKARAARPSIILRADPLVIALAGAQGKSPEELDAFFTTYAAV